MKDTMERAKLKSELDNRVRLLTAAFVGQSAIFKQSAFTVILVLGKLAGIDNGIVGASPIIFEFRITGFRS